MKFFQAFTLMSFLILSLTAGCGSRPGLDGIDAGVDAGGDAAPPMPCGTCDWTAPGSPWPMYLGCPERRGRSAAVGPATPDNIRYLGEVSRYTETEEWSLDSMSRDGPVITSDGTLYIGSARYYYDDDYPTDLWSQQIIAFDPDGTERVIYETELIEIDPIMDPSPAYPPKGLTISADGHIYFYDTIGSKIQAIDRNGQEVLSAPYSAHYLNVGPDDSIYVNDREDYYNSFLVALAPDGTQKWTFSIGIGAPSPTLDSEGRIYFSLSEIMEESSVYALETDGSFLWKTDIQEYITSQISIGDNGSLYFFARESVDDPPPYYLYSFYSMSAEGEILWSRLVEGYSEYSIAIGPGGMVVGATNEAVYAFTPDGDLLWTYEGETGAMTGGRPTIDGEGTSYIGMSGGLHAIRRDGTLKWKTEAGSRWNAVVIGADGTLYVSSGKKGLCVIEH